MGENKIKYIFNRMGKSKRNRKLRDLGASDEHVVSLIE